MASLIPKSLMKAIFCAVMVMLIVSFAGIDHAKAFQKKQADTVSTGDVQFTGIPTAADSIARRKKATQEVAKIKPANNIKVAGPEKPKTLWQIFIAGFLGGFLALLMPCIYPL